jgi:hypothetical protein
MQRRIGGDGIVGPITGGVVFPLKTLRYRIPQSKVGTHGFGEPRLRKNEKGPQGFLGAFFVECCR